jgi:hypothetical protein
MRTVRVLLRLKPSRSDTRLSAKVVTNCRVPGRARPVQIHIGYLSLIFDGGIPPGRRERLLKNLRSKWQLLFSSSDVDIDWVDAEAKLQQLRARQIPASPATVSTGVGGDRSPIKARHAYQATEDKANTYSDA